MKLSNLMQPKKPKVVLPRDAYLREHRRLVNILRAPTPATLRSEAREQAEDLKEAKKL